MTRNIRCEFTIDADIEDVWQAITEAQHLANWFPPYAESKSGADGYVSLGWNDADNMEKMTFADWQENQRLVLNWHAAPAGQKPILLPVDIRLKTLDSGTELKLVQSGFLSDESWDDEYSSHSRGWNTELRFLVYYLEQQFGRTRQFFKTRIKIPDVENAMGRIIGPDRIFGTETNSLRENDTFQLRLPSDRQTACKVLYDLSTLDFVFICDELQQGAIRLSIESFGGTPELLFYAFSWQLIEEELIKVVEPWVEAIADEFVVKKDTNQPTDSIEPVSHPG